MGSTQHFLHGLCKRCTFWGIENWWPVRNFQALQLLERQPNYFLSFFLILAGHFETLPFTKDEVRSVYHCRQIEVFKLLQLANSPDIFLSRAFLFDQSLYMLTPDDWPRGIEKYGDVPYLLRKKPDFETEVSAPSLSFS